MSNQISENLFESIDTIVEQRLKDLSFDKTLTCKIISRDEKDDSLYWVSNDTINFQARASGDESYSKNEEVYVLISNGDYSQEKIIIGSRVNNIEKQYNKVKYITEKEKVVINNTFELINESSQLKIQATNDNKLTETIYSWDLSNNKKFAYNLPIETLGVEFSLDTMEIFEIQKINQTGIYSIGIEFYNIDKDGNEKLLNNHEEDYTIFSTEVFGNPYALNSNFKNFKALPFKLQNITDIDKIKIILKQNGGFDLGDSNIAKYIKLTSLFLSFGYYQDSSNISKNRLILKNGQSKTYTTDYVNEERTLYGEWHYGNKIFNYLNLPTEEDFQNFTIYYMVYSEGYGDRASFTDDNGEIKKKCINWSYEKIQNVISTNGSDPAPSPFVHTVFFADDVPFKQYKIIIQYKLTNEDGYQYDEIPLYKFTHEDYYEEGFSTSSPDGIILSLIDNDNGNYNFYSSNGKLSNTALAQKQYSITAELIDEPDINWSQYEVEWLYPKDEASSMLTNIDITDNIFKYNLKSVRFMQSNIITCQIRKRGSKQIKKASITLQFGNFQSSGSNYSFNIHFKKNEEGKTPTCLDLSKDWNKTILVEATLESYVDNNAISTIDISTQNIEWSWVFPNKEEEDKTSLYYNSGEPLEIIKTVNNTNICELKLYYIEENQITSIVPLYNYAILKATLPYTLDNGITVNLTDYLPIPISKDANKWSYIGGMTEVVYDSAGTKVSNSSSAPYTMYPERFEEEENEIHKKYRSTWVLQTEWNDLTLKKRVCREKEEIEYNDYILSLPSIAPNTIPKAAINYYPPTDTVLTWSQPILITQNHWSNQWINGWDNSLVIDKENNVIGTSMLVAGTNGAEGFTGVKLGALVNEDSSKPAGLYGLKDGAERFRLTEDGEFFVGTDNGNHIEFDDNGDLQIKVDGLSVKATEINIETDYMQLDDKAGIFKLYGKGEKTDPLFSFYTDTLSNGILKIKGELIAETLNLGNNNTSLSFDGTHLLINTTNFLLDDKGSVYITGEINATSGRALSWEVYKDKTFITKYGVLGLVSGSDGLGDTENIGIDTTHDEAHSIILDSGRNIRLTARENIYINLEDTSTNRLIHLTAEPPSNIGGGHLKLTDSGVILDSGYDNGAYMSLNRNLATDSSASIGYITGIKIQVLHRQNNKLTNEGICEIPVHGVTGVLYIAEIGDISNI